MKLIVLLGLISLSACGISSTIPSNDTPSIYSNSIIKANSSSTCPTQSLYVRISKEIRGYPASSTGSVSPCTDIKGSNTQMSYPANNQIAISIHGYIHTLEFQGGPPYYSMEIFPYYVTGNVAPSRLVRNVDRDGRAFTIDSNTNDFVLSSANPGLTCWFVVSSNATTPSTTRPCDNNFSAIKAFSVTSSNNLVIAGLDSNNNARIDIVSNPTSTNDSVVQTITGSNTGILNVSMALAVDQIKGTIYVYSSDNTTPKVSEFNGTDNGNVTPIRVISGVNAKLPLTVFNQEVIALDTSSNLYVNSTGVSNNYATFSVFNYGVSGNVAPSRTFYDTGFSNNGMDFGTENGSIAVRTH